MVVVDVVPGLPVDEGEFVRCRTNNWAIVLVKLMSALGKISFY